MELIWGAFIASTVLALLFTGLSFVYLWWIDSRCIVSLDEHDPEYPGALGPVVYPIYDLSPELPGVAITDNLNIVEEDNQPTTNTFLTDYEDLDVDALELAAERARMRRTYSQP